MTAVNWKIATLGSIGKVISGYAFKTAQFQETGIPVIKIQNVKDGIVDLTGATCVEEDFLSLDEKYHVVN